MIDRVMKNLQGSWRSLLFPACLTGLVLGLGGLGLWSYHRVSERLATLEQARPISVNVRHLSAKLLEAYGPDADASVVIGEVLQQVQRELEALAEAGFVVIAAEAALSGVPDATTRLYQKLPNPNRGGSIMARKVGSLGLAGVALLSLGLLALYPFGYRLAWNTTPSMTGHLFLLFPSRTFQRGDLVSFEPTPETLAFVPHYARRKKLWVKRLLGVPGDHIKTDYDSVWVADIYVGMGQKHTRDGTELRLVQAQRVPPGAYFVGGEHLRSYDSRYEAFGFIPRDRLKGRALRLF